MKIFVSKKCNGKYIVTILFVLFGIAVVGLSMLGSKNVILTGANKILQPVTIIIDAGHGGVDGGAVAPDQTVESQINLDIALTINELFSLTNINTKMIRTEDISIHDAGAKTIRQKKVSDLRNRLNIVETTPNAVLVSIHQNIYSASSACGTQVFYSKNNANSKALADCIQNNVVAFLQPDNKRQTKQAGSDIFLLYKTAAPAVMVECGFLSNQAELEELKTGEYRQQIAYAVFDGVLNYLSLTEEL